MTIQQAAHEYDLLEDNPNTDNEQMETASKELLEKLRDAKYLSQEEFGEAFIDGINVNGELIVGFKGGWICIHLATGFTTRHTDTDESDIDEYGRVTRPI